MSGRPVRILFVCMGNICRSPAAEAIFRHRMAAVGVSFEVDSAGTGGWHEGEAPDPRTQRVLLGQGIEPVGTARKVQPSDFDRFDLVIAMDRANRDDLLAAGADPSRVRLLLEWHPERRGADVPDPYHGGDDGFRHMYRLIDRACAALLAELAAADQAGLTRPWPIRSGRTR